MYKINLSTAAAVMGDDVYFSALYHNALLKMNMRTGITEYICSFGKEKKIAGIYVKAFCYEALVWFIPLYGEYITCYDACRNKVEYYNVPGIIYDRPCMEKYCLNDYSQRIVPKYLDAGRIDQENIYLVPAGTDTAVLLNMKTREMTFVPDIVNSENEFIGCGTFYEGKIWMAPYEGSQLVSLDIRTGEIQRMECGRKTGTYYGICGYEGKIWFSSLTDKGIMVWDIQKEEYGEMPCRNVNSGHEGTYRDIVNFNDTLWMIPNDSEKIIYWSTGNRCFVDYGCGIKPGLGIMAMADAGNGFMCTVSYSYNYVFRLHRDNAGYDICTPQISVAQLYDILKCNYGRDALYMLMERYGGGIPEKDLEIEDYIELSVLQELDDKKPANAGGRIRQSVCGKHILKKI